MISSSSRIWICVGLFFLLLCSGSARAQPKTPFSGFLSLSEAIQIALTHNPLMNEVQAQVDISNERLVQARSGFMPRIDASGAYNRRTNPAQTFATKLNQGLAISLMAGEVASLLFSRMTVPILYFLDKRWEKAHLNHSPEQPTASGS